MRRNLTTTRAALTAILAGTVVLFSSAISFAGTPSLGADCGASASIVGSDSAGKVTLGAGTTSTCTITFSVPYTNGPACTATNETNGGNYSKAVGSKSTQSGVVIGGAQDWSVGDVIAYICAEY